MAEIEKRNTMLALRMQQAEEIKQAVACFIPENEENQGIFTKNCLFYIIKNKAVMSDNWLTINNIQVDLFEFLQKMYLASKAGLSLVEGEFTPVTFDGGEFVLMPDFRAEKRIAEEKGLIISFLHGRDGDEFTEEANPLKHQFKIKSRVGKFQQIQQKTATAKSGKQYSICEAVSDIKWYACIAKVIATGEEFSYVESAENIIMRANPKTLKFYKDPNAQEVMHEKFVLRQLIKRLPSNLRGIDFDKFEGKFEDVEDAQVIEEEAKPTAKPKPILVKDSETWKKMEKAILDGKVANMDVIERKYDINGCRTEIATIFGQISAKTEEVSSEKENAENDEKKAKLVDKVFSPMDL